MQRKIETLSRLSVDEAFDSPILRGLAVLRYCKQYHGKEGGKFCQTNDLFERLREGIRQYLLEREQLRLQREPEILASCEHLQAQEPARKLSMVLLEDLYASSSPKDWSYPAPASESESATLSRVSPVKDGYGSSSTARANSLRAKDSQTQPKLPSPPSPPLIQRHDSIRIAEIRKAARRVVSTGAEKQRPVDHQGTTTEHDNSEVDEDLQTTVSPLAKHHPANGPVTTQSAIAIAKTIGALRPSPTPVLPDLTNLISREQGQVQTQRPTRAQETIPPTH